MLAVDWTLRHRILVIGITLAVFAASLAGFRFVPQQFFPSSDRPELLVDLTLPQSASIFATETTAKRLEEEVDNFSSDEGASAATRIKASTSILDISLQINTNIWR